MPEAGEGVSVDKIVSAIEHDEDCYFCKAKEPRTEENDLSDDPAEDEDLDGPPFDAKFKNDASKLGKALGESPAMEIRVDGTEWNVVTAAHHLIPGNASLKESELFYCNKYLWKDGKVNGNIGYNVNSAANGVWLPGNYAVRPWSTRDPVFQKKYAYAAMEKYGAQFHDAHGSYSTFVTGQLDKLYDKLKKGVPIVCPEASKRSERDPQKDPVLYDIVARLNTISQRMRRFLIGDPKNWREPIWTSRFAESMKTDILSATNGK